jgi:hypothetical protein
MAGKILRHGNDKVFSMSWSSSYEGNVSEILYAMLGKVTEVYVLTKAYRQMFFYACVQSTKVHFKEGDDVHRLSIYGGA